MTEFITFRSWKRVINGVEETVEITPLREEKKKLKGLIIYGKTDLIRNSKLPIDKKFIDRMIVTDLVIEKRVRDLND